MIVREARLSDAYEIALVHVDSWRTTYRNILPEQFLMSLSYEKRQQMWLTNIPKSTVFVAENNKGKIVGFASSGKDDSGSYKEYQIELSSIYILEEYQGQGIGKILLKSVINDFRNIGINTMRVHVLEDNNAKFFYEALGGKNIDRVEIESASKKLNELVYGWDNISAIFS